jgi:hypothetical protein
VTSSNVYRDTIDAGMRVLSWGTTSKVAIPIISLKPESKSKLSYDRRPIGQSVLVSGYTASSLRKGRVSNLQLMFDLASAASLVSEFRGNHGKNVIVSDLRRPQPGEPGSRMFPPETG